MKNEFIIEARLEMKRKNIWSIDFIISWIPTDLWTIFLIQRYQVFKAFNEIPNNNNNNISLLFT